jgi:hypothetical protein
LWQGRPSWKSFAQRVFQVRKLAVYFAILLGWYAASSFVPGETYRTAALGTLRMTGVALTPLVLVYVFAWLTSRSTVYTITDRRVVFSIGIALQVRINLPFKKVESAGLETWPDGSGSIALALLPREKIAYLALWPHARPWRVSRPEPMLRCIPDAQRVSQILARALATEAGMAVQPAPQGASAAPQRDPVTALA